jgi:hypothetical protein
MNAGQPVRFVECKTADAAVNPALLYLVRKFATVEAVQVLATRGVDRAGRDGVRLVSAGSVPRGACGLNEESRPSA